MNRRNFFGTLFGFVGGCTFGNRHLRRQKLFNDLIHKKAEADRQEMRLAYFNGLNRLLVLNGTHPIMSDADFAKNVLKIKVS